MKAEKSQRELLVHLYVGGATNHRTWLSWGIATVSKPVSSKVRKADGAGGGAVVQNDPNGLCNLWEVEPP